MNKGGLLLGSDSLQKRIEEQKEANPEKKEQKRKQRLHFFTPEFVVSQQQVQSKEKHGCENGIDRSLELDFRHVLLHMSSS
jgi:hypothetical protein